MQVALRICVAVLLCGSVGAHMMTVCSSQSLQQPGYVTVWVATYHETYERDTKSVLHVVGTSENSTNSTATFAPCRTRSMPGYLPSVEDISNELSASCSNMTMPVDGGDRLVFPAESTLVCYNGARTGQLGVAMEGREFVSMCFMERDVYAWHAAVIASDGDGLHEVWVDSAANSTAPLAPSWEDDRMPCSMSSSAHWNLPFVKARIYCAPPPAHLLNNVSSNDCDNVFWVGQTCRFWCESGYAPQGELQCVESANGTGVWSAFACVPHNPVTRAPGVDQVCEEHHTVDTSSAGNVSFASNADDHTVCWEFSCSKNVLITFTAVATRSNSFIILYSSGSDAYIRDWTPISPGADIVLNSTALVQFWANGYQSGTSAFELNYMCVDATPAPPTDVPATSVPGVYGPCEEHTDLNNGSGNVSFVDTAPPHMGCWEITCDKDVVLSFSLMRLIGGSLLYLYNRSQDGQEYYQNRRLSNTDGEGDVVLRGSVFIYFRKGAVGSAFEFDYECVDATTPAPSTNVPNTMAPGVNSACDEHTDFNNATGEVTFVTSETYHTACWRMACGKDVVLSFSVIEIDYSSTVRLYSSPDGSTFVFDRSFTQRQRSAVIGFDIVLRGTAFVQFRGSYREWSALSFSYECVDATSPSPPTNVPYTQAPGTYNTCDEYTELDNSIVGNVSLGSGRTDYTVCWHIECDKDVVISFSTMDYGSTVASLQVFNWRDSDNRYNRQKGFDSGSTAKDDVVVSGSALVQFVAGYFPGRTDLEFTYVCVDATTPAPPTDVPETTTPGVQYVCDEDTALTNEGGLMFLSTQALRVECWHIACAKDVILRFSTMHLTSYSELGLYSVQNGATLVRSFGWDSDVTGVDIVVSGPALMQFKAPFVPGSALEFDWVCAEATSPSPPTGTLAPAPPTGTPHTLAPGVRGVCDEHNDLNDTAGNVSYTHTYGYHKECWYIACEGNVMIVFSTMQIDRGAELELYSSGPAVTGDRDYTLQEYLRHTDSSTGANYLLKGSAFVQFRGNHGGVGNSTLEFDYTCAAPHTLAPGVRNVCDEQSDLNDTAGNVSFTHTYRHHVKCWHIACEGNVVIVFSAMPLAYGSSLDIYSSGGSDNYTLNTSFHSFDHFPAPMGVNYVLNGSAFVQFGGSYEVGSSPVEFEYTCMDATESPPTDLPDTPPPMTSAPGVSRVCDEHTFLDDAAGNVTFVSRESYHTECWEIECEHEVVIASTTMELYDTSRLFLYSADRSMNGTQYTLETTLHSDAHNTSTVVDVVLSGPAFVQFHSGLTHSQRSFVDFSYECRAPTPPPQQQCLGDTVPQRCRQGTSRACAFEVRHPARLLSVAFSGDGSRVATGAMDSIVRVFDARTGVQVSQLGCADFKVHDIAFSPDNKLVALAGEGGRVVVCNAATGVLEATLMDMSASGSTPVHRVEFTRDGRYAVSGGGSDSRTRIFDLLSSDMTKASSVLDHHARDVAFSVDGAHLATVRGTEVDEVTSVWSLDGTSAVELPSVGARVTALSFSSSAGGNVLLRGMSDGTILVSQLLDGFGGNSTGGGGDGDDNTGGDGDGNTGGDGGGNTGGGGDGGGNTGGDGGGNSTGGGGDGDSNTGGDGDGNTGGDGDGHGDDVGTSPWDSSVVEGVSLSLTSGIVYDSKFSRNGQKIAAVGGGDVMVWSHDGSVLHELLGHSPAILPRLDFSPDGTRLATVSRDGTLVVWKL